MMPNVPPDSTDGGTAGAILVLVVILFLAWWWIWPQFLALVLHIRWPWLDIVRNNVGAIILVLVAASAVMLWVGTLALGRGIESDDVDAQIGALAVAAAVAFTYGSLVPPAVSTRFYPVDMTTCDWSDFPRLTTVSLQRGVLNPVMVGFWNVGIGSWGPFRVNVSFPGDGWVVALTDLTVPQSETWDWRTIEEDVRVTRRPASIQVDKNQPLVPGEPQVLRFLVRPPATGTNFKLTVTVGSQGRFGETRAVVKADVVDIPGP